MVVCKNCKSGKVVKNGIVRGKQRYRCKGCGYNFVEGDGRTNEKVVAKKAMCVLLYSLSKASFNGLARIFDTWPSLVYRWIVEAGAKLPDTAVSGEIKEMEFDEMWHFIGLKKEKFGSSKQLIVAEGELWPGCSAIVILKPSNASTIR
jgi:transposase